MGGNGRWVMAARGMMGRGGMMGLVIVLLLHPTEYMGRMTAVGGTFFAPLETV